VASERPHAIVQFIRTFSDPLRVAEVPDGQLLKQFADRNDETAFAALVKRHGRLVLSVCQRVLRNDHDAEDAFQATFLVLARKSRSIAKQYSVGSWLHGVAFRVAARARNEIARRREAERKVEPMPAPDLLQEVAYRDLRILLDEEVQRLPSRCREPFVLCYMEGVTNKEAALLLACPHGTILSRLARARELLRKRLVRRGLTLSAGLIATVLSQESVRAAVPVALARATVRAGTMLSAQALGSISTKALYMAEGVLRAMLWSKIKNASLVLVAIGLFASGAGLLGHAVFAGQDPGVGAANPTRPATVDEPRKQPAPEPEGKKAFENAVGYVWAVTPSNGRGSPWATSWLDLRKKGESPPSYTGIVCIEEVDKDGGLMITIAHPANTTSSGLPNFRPVAFDADRHRYPLKQEFGAGAASVAMCRYRLDPKALPAKSVEYLGVEIVAPEGEKVIAVQAAKRAKKEGVKVLPFAEIGKPFDFTLTSVDGKKLSSKDLRGKVVLIDCWATWCSPCMALLPEIKDLHAKYHEEGLEVIGICHDQDAATMTKACKKLGVSWPQVLLPNDENIRELWKETSGIGSLPRVLILDKAGILRVDSPSNVEEAVSKLLKGRE
jgi:RNA polymerase sigma factor (sigma-70 family)